MVQGYCPSNIIGWDTEINRMKQLYTNSLNADSTPTLNNTFYQNLSGIQWTFSEHLTSILNQPELTNIQPESNSHFATTKRGLPRALSEFTLHSGTSMLTQCSCGATLLWTLIAITQWTCTQFSFHIHISVRHIRHKLGQFLFDRSSLVSTGIKNEVL